jgi:hypothetical protein
VKIINMLVQDNKVQVLVQMTSPFVRQI